ncbi:MAG: polyprenyl synthetase family protein [Acidimicrobiales bacterium]
MAEPDDPSPSHTTAPPTWLATIGRGVEDRLRMLFDLEIERWSAVDPELGTPLACLAELTLSGGKRLRPAFCHWAFVGAGGDPADPLVTDVGAAFELLHAFALIHDDVMDGSDYRRGLRTVHQQYARRHAEMAWRGEARRFGEGVAILVGDLAFVYADTLLGGVSPEARSLYDEMRIEINVGQYLDMVGSAQAQATVAGTKRIARYKSAKYTIERPLHIGAALRNRLDDLSAPFSAYGLPLGEAFQLRDDVLGAFGNRDATGKPVGDDLLEGKPTLLLALARESATGNAAAILDRVGAPDLAAGEIEAMQEILVSTGALERIETLISSLVDQALGALEDAPIEEEARSALLEIAPYVAWRDR